MTGKQLKNSILQWAIQGKLVPQDPNDEPASVLLEKIRAEKARLIKEKKIKKEKNESIIYRGDDNSYYEKLLATGEVKCIDEEIPFEIPQGWEWCRIRDIISATDAGKSPNCDKRPKKENEWGVLTTTAIQNCKFLPEENKVLPSTFVVSKAMAVVYEDILITRAGPKNRTAVACVVDTEVNGLILSDKTVRINSLREFVNPYYLAYVINSPTIRETIMAFTVGMAASQVNISQGNIQSILIPLPPKKEQGKIVNKLLSITPIVEHYNKTQEELNSLNFGIQELLKKSILQEAIQGKLVPQIEEEGTAEELLAEISKEKERLIKEGKLKKSALNESVIFKGDDNKYYEQIGNTISELDTDYTLPESWAVLKLRDICQLTDGEKREGKHVCLDAKFLRGKYSGEYLYNGKFVHKGDDIILVDGENSGEVFSVPVDGYMGSTFKQLWISSEAYKPYVLLFILYFKDKLRNSKKGAAIPHLNKDIFYNLIIGIPPMKEQQRIVHQVNSLFQHIK